MNSIYQQALDGTLISAPLDGGFEITVKNLTPIALIIQRINHEGTLQSGSNRFDPNNEIRVQANIDVYFVVRSSVTGSFFSVFMVTEQNRDVSITTTELSLPFNIAAIPTAKQGMIIPPNSPKVIVGVGTIPHHGNQIIREQYWKRLHDSYSLYGNEEKTINHSVTTGIQQSSSTMQNISESMGLNVHSGWATFSASMSASLNRNTTRTQEISMHTETTRFVTDVIRNETTNTQVYLKWQLMDVFTIANNDNVLSRVEVGQSPQIFAEPYNPASLPANNIDYDNIHSHLI